MELSFQVFPINLALFLGMLFVVWILPGLFGNKARAAEESNRTLPLP